MEHTNTIDRTAAQALRVIASIIIEAVADSGPMGAPGGYIYAALMTQGCTLGQYEGIMAGMVNAGLIVKRGECYFVKGKAE